MAQAQGQGKIADFDSGLKDLYVQAASLPLAPDAPPEAQQFSQVVMKGVVQFRQMVAAKKAQQAAGQAQQAAMGAAQGGAAGGAAGGAMGAGSPGGAPGMGGGSPGTGGPGGAAPAPNQIAPGGGAGMSGYGGVANPDDLQRILAGTGGQG